MTTADLLAGLIDAARQAAPEELPALLGKVAEAEALLRARLIAPSRPSATQEEDRLLDMPEVAQILGIPEDRAYDLGRQRALPVVVIGKYRRVRLSAVRAFIADSEKKTLDRAEDGPYSSFRDGASRRRGRQRGRTRAHDPAAPSSSGE